MSCRTCADSARTDAPVRDAIVRTAHWRVAHAFGMSIPGWLVLVPLEHVTSFAALTPEAAAELGPLLRRVDAALQAETGCVKTYVAMFAEAEGFSHLHVHVVPRAADLPAEHQGPRVFATAVAEGDPREVPVAVQDDLATRLAQRLG